MKIRNIYFDKKIVKIDICTYMIIFFNVIGLFVRKKYCHKFLVIKKNI